MSQILPKADAHFIQLIYSGKAFTIIEKAGDGSLLVMGNQASLVMAKNGDRIAKVHNLPDD